MNADPEPIGPIDSLAVPRFAGFRTFARLPMRSQVERADVAVLGAPFDGATTFRPGARYGPQAIREASLLLRPHNEPLGISPFAIAQVVDAGDAPAGSIDVAQAHGAIRASAEALHGAGTTVLGLGGDHSITLPLLHAAAARFGPLALIQVDAHPDTSDEFYGSQISHGTIVRRAVEQGLVDPRRSIQIGLRGPLYDADEYARSRELGFATILAREIDELGVAGIVARTREVVGGGPVYLTFDIDALDPAFAPGTGTPEAGGFTSREALRLLRGLAGTVEVVAADLVEVAPAYDPTGVTAATAAAVAFELVTMLALASVRT
jgi:agmatinase